MCVSLNALNSFLFQLRRPPTKLTTSLFQKDPLSFLPYCSIVTQYISNPFFETQTLWCDNIIENGVTVLSEPWTKNHKGWSDRFIAMRLLSAEAFVENFPRKRTLSSFFEVVILHFLLLHFPLCIHLYYILSACMTYGTLSLGLKFRKNPPFPLSFINLSVWGKKISNFLS